jgi:hypothetical protein
VLARARRAWRTGQSIHPLGIVGRAGARREVDRDSPLYALCNAAVVDSGRLPAARCALAIAGRSMKSTGDLSNYTGEFWGEHPKADLRLDFATRAVVKHPFTAAYQSSDGE